MSRRFEQLRSGWRWWRGHIWSLVFSRCTGLPVISSGMDLLYYKNYLTGLRYCNTITTWRTY